MLRITGIKIHGVKVYRARLFKESNNSGVVFYCQEGMKKVRIEGNEIFKHEYVGEINRGKYMLYTVWRGVDYALANQLNYLPECTEIVDDIHVFFDGITLDKLSNDTILCANICQYLLKEGILENDGFITDCICGYSCTYEVPDMEKLKAILTKYKAMEGCK